MLKVSTDYQEISEAEALANPLSSAWCDPSIPAQQLQLTDAELVRWLKGEPVAPYDALRSCLQKVKSGSVLEIGCGVGHGAPVILDSGEFVYTGIDYSEEFIRVAKSRRPGRLFRVMDALRLDYPARSFDIAISSCCILHIVDWRTAIKEAARVAKYYLILHRTPVSNEPTRYFFKKAYGVSCVEIHFNEQDIIDAVAETGFSKVAEFYAGTDQKTYLFERVNMPEAA